MNRPVVRLDRWATSMYWAIAAIAVYCIGRAAVAGELDSMLGWVVAVGGFTAALLEAWKVRIHKGIADRYRRSSFENLRKYQAAELRKEER